MPKLIQSFLFSIPLVAMMAMPALAQDTPAFDSGDTAWMLVSALLVLMMTVPGLALFYGGLVKKDNILATLMQSVAIAAIVSVVWPIIGYSLAFTENNMFIGGLDLLMLNGLTPDSASGTIPESVFIIFQMTFAIITIALLVGAVADRIKFSTVLVFTPLWLILVYAPITHWVWGPGGWIGGIGLEDYEGILGYGEALDFAGGTVVHINSGVAGLVAALVIGRSLNPSQGPSDSSNLVMSVIGAGMLWVGWFGFNAGSALAAGAGAGYAMLVTNAAAGAAAVVWILVEMLHKGGKASVHGAVSGLVAGLVAITPAAGFVDFQGSLILGASSGLFCYVAVTYLKHLLRVDDALDVFALHGIGGIVGAVLVGVLANPDIGGAAGTLYGGEGQLMAQIISIVVVAVYSAVVTAVLLFILRFTIGLRVQPKEEYEGLDLALHGQNVD